MCSVLHWRCNEYVRNKFDVCHIYDLNKYGGYATVGVIAILVLPSTLVLKYPPWDQINTIEVVPGNIQPGSGLKHIMTVRVLLIGLARCGYLTFLTWATSYLQQTVGLYFLAHPVLRWAILWPVGLRINKRRNMCVQGPARLMLVTVIVTAICLIFLLCITRDPKQFLTLTLTLGFLTFCDYKLRVNIRFQQIKTHLPY